MSRKICLYGLDEERRKEVIDELKNAGFNDVVVLGEEDLDSKVIQVFDEVEESREYRSRKNMKIDDEFMILGGFGQEDLEDLLSVFRDSGVKRPISCSITKSNAMWTLEDLFKELKEEDEYMKKNFG